MDIYKICTGEFVTLGYVEAETVIDAVMCIHADGHKFSRYTAEKIEPHFADNGLSSHPNNVDYVFRSTSPGVVQVLDKPTDDYEVRKEAMQKIRDLLTDDEYELVFYR